MFEKFTDRARQVVVLAQDEARRLRHKHIGTEHILLGLIHEGDGVAAQALQSLGIGLDAVRLKVEEITPPGEHTAPGHIPFTPRAKKVLELSLRESLDLGHNYIGTEHILLGLIREGRGVAAAALAGLGADPSRVRQSVVQLVAADEESPAAIRHPRSQVVLAEIAERLDAIAARLAAIEQRLGIEPPPAPPAQEQAPPGEQSA